MRNFLLSSEAAKIETNIVFFLAGMTAAGTLVHYVYGAPTMDMVLAVASFTIAGQAALNLTRHMVRTETDRGPFPRYDVLCVCFASAVILTAFMPAGSLKVTLTGTWFVAALMATGAGLYHQKQYPHWAGQNGPPRKQPQGEE